MHFDEAGYIAQQHQVLIEENSPQVGLFPVQPPISHLLSSLPIRLKPSIQEKVATEPNVVVVMSTGRPFSGLRSPTVPQSWTTGREGGGRRKGER